MTGNRPSPLAVVPTVIALIAILVLALLPDFGPRIATENRPVQAFHGRILAIVPVQTDEPLRPPNARVELLDGPRAGETVDAYLEGPGGSQIVANYQPGDEVVVTFTEDASGAPHIAVSDRWRAPLLGAFVLLFAAAVVVVGGLRGARALVSLGLTIAIILKVLIPLVISGVAPVPLAVLTATGVTVVAILLTEGPSRASGAAILGTAGALALTGLLAAAATAIASFTYTSGSDLAFIETADGRGLDLRGLLLAAFILGTVGVLDDVTVTQASLVGNLSSRGVHGRDLVTAALDVGRSHIAATVNTLFMAYVGAGLPLLVTVVVSQQPSTLILNSEVVATEVIRTLVGSLGILAAVPFTTFVAVAVLDRARDDVAARRSLVAASGVVVAALVLTTVLPLGSGRAALAEDRFEPLPSDGVAGGPSDEPSLDPLQPVPSLDPGASAPDLEILAVGDTFELTTDGATVAISITALDAVVVAGRTEVTIGVAYRNAGAAPFALELAAWQLIASSGDEASLEPTPADGLAGGPLAPGDASQGSMRGSVAALPDDAFVTFTDTRGVIRFAVPANGS